MPGKSSTSVRSRSTPRERIAAEEVNTSRSTRPKRPPTPTKLSTVDLEESFRPSSGSGSRPSSRPGSSSGRPATSSRPSSRGSCGSCCEDEKDGHKCICDICTCGDHKCPPKYKGSTVPFDGQTTSSQTYQGHDPAHFPVRATAPKSLYTGIKVPASHFATTNNSHFVNHDVTSYLQPHQEKISQTQAIREVPREKFDASSSHRNDYPWHPSDAHATKETKLFDSSLRGTSLGSNGSSQSNMYLDTSYGSHFVGHTGKPRTPAQKPSSDYSYGAPREFTTTNRHHFDGKQNVQHKHKCPAHKLPTRPHSAESGHVKYRFDSDTGIWG